MDSQVWPCTEMLAIPWNAHFFCCSQDPVHTVHQCPLHWNYINCYNYLVLLTTATLLCWLLQLSAEPDNVTIFWTTESQTGQRVWHSPRTDPPSAVHISTDLSANQFFIMISQLTEIYRAETRTGVYPYSHAVTLASKWGWQYMKDLERSWLTQHISHCPHSSLSFTTSYNKHYISHQKNFYQ